MSKKFAHTQEELEKLSLKELENLAASIREKIIQVVSKNGGHLSSNLGAVELSIAMHLVFDAKKILLFLMCHINLIHTSF